MTNLQIVVFNLNNEICGAETDQVKQIIKYQPLTKVPKMPKFIEGVFNLRGSVIPVINLNTRLELGVTDYNKKTKILLTEINGKMVGFIVNDIKELMKYTEEDVETLPGIINEAGNVYISKVVKRDDEIISIINLHMVLTESELKKV